MTKWIHIDTTGTVKYKCGYCEREIASNIGWNSDKISSGSDMKIRICPNCSQPTYFDFDGNQIPSTIFGNKVEHLPSPVEKLYNEARACTQVNAYTSSILACRKLLMNIAVSKGAKKGLSFQEYVNYLDSKRYTPPDSKEWVDHIRKKGNEATHEIALKTEDDAIELINFVEMLLKFIYEFPSKMKIKKESK